MINKPPPFKGLHIRITMIIPIKGRRCINQASGLGLECRGFRLTVFLCPILHKKQTLFSNNPEKKPILPKGLGFRA